MLVTCCVAIVSIAVWENISRGVTSSTGFNDDLDDWLASNLRNDCYSFSREWLETNLIVSVKVTTPIMVDWKPPCVGCVKLNIDSGCNVDSSAIYVRCVIRDHLRNWVRGFALNKGVSIVLEAELWGLFEGLTMAWNGGFMILLWNHTP
ncbi:hypothetical protein Ddye_002370 [Dipteronia dyeriana]|uniref:RNase H type-1 domain-containing protein n=1 Tax=Dipteronia dyeriana TaxID=168575 RepID=A0AAD9XQ68_9ROSI|nr:hypothetical protein Ddye_002370 [Dipteronia dyeriana]